MSDNSQKSVGRKRAPRVQIEYDVETGGAEKKVSLPFVSGVLSDLAGKSVQPPIAERKFVSFDHENFNDRMAAMKPSTSFRVKNTLSQSDSDELTDELSVDLKFSSIEDFNPDAVAEQVAPLNELLQARRQLNDLLARLDGKAEAEKQLETLLGNNALLQQLAGTVKKRAAIVGNVIGESVDE